jgi:dihydrofolate reductase
VSTAVRKLIESTLVSLDGTIESPERWAAFDDEATQLAMQELDSYDAFVMGRVTYERFRANWAPVSGNPYVDRIAAMPKYVASRSLTEVTWNATLLGPDIVGAIERLKAQPGKDLIKYGTSRLDDTLLRAHLVDELRLWIMPVVVGTGRRLFAGVDTSSLDLRLTDVRKLANGSAILTYVPS